MKRALACCLIMTLSSALQGCSFMFVDGPPADHPQRQHFTCTTSRLGPIVDTVFAVSYGSSAAQVALSNHDDNDDNDDVSAALAILALAGLFGASAYVGYTDTAECSDAMDALQARRTLEVPSVIPTRPEPGSAVGCVSNEQCKIGRVCMQGTCVDPVPPVQVIVPVTPAPITTPPPQTAAPAPAPPLDQRPVLLFEGLPSQNAPPTPPPSQPAP